MRQFCVGLLEVRETDGGNEWDMRRLSRPVGLIARHTRQTRLIVENTILKKNKWLELVE